MRLREADIRTPSVLLHEDVLDLDKSLQDGADVVLGGGDSWTGVASRLALRV
jgi:hypothetical protein